MGICCIGKAVWDITCPFDAELVSDRKYVIPSHVEGAGGQALNAACVCARFGAPVSLVARLGDDAYGARIRKICADAGVDMSLMLDDPTATTSSSLVLANGSTGERTCFNFPSSESEVELRLPDVPPTVILGDGHEAFASHAYLRAFPDAASIVDAGSLRPGTLAVAQESDYIVASEVFAEQYLGHPLAEGGSRLRDDLLRLRRINDGCQVVVTRGARGVAYLDGDEAASMPAFEAKAVDSTGAGDIFHGAFAFGIDAGLPLEECLRLAQMTASISVTRMGSQRSIPSLDEVRARLHEAGFEPVV
jgi:sulfofructose kinase